MVAWRALGGMVVLLAGVPAVRAETYPLTEDVKPGDCFRIQMTMTLAGEMRVHQEGKPLAIKLTAEATQEFPERVLGVARTGEVEKTARIYETAQATITVGHERSERKLRPDRRLIVAQWHNDQQLAYCPAGPLFRDEQELTSEHFDTLRLPGLLPGKPVVIGDTWKVANSAVQALCNFEGLTEQNLTCKLEEVKDNVARVSVTGTANGIDLGALAKLQIEANYHFDLTAHRLVWLEWKQTDERDQGPASPATAVQATTTLKRTPIDQPEGLSDVALVGVPSDFTPPPVMVQIDYADARGRFDLLHSRDWYLVGQTEEHAVLRLLERGDFVAQVTITPWTAAEKGKHLSAEDFKTAMAQTPGWEAEKELQSGEVPLPSGDGRWIYRVSMQGHLDGLEVIQTFYVVANPEGKQVVLAFTMTPKQAEKLGTRDLSLVGSLELPPAKK